ncbi:MAG TPA: MFS transporter [Frankiaceae bacterium]|nr:MFS transporter [Frankiaceae bacterium]
MSRRPLYGLYAANGVSITGNILTVLAVPWFVLQTTGSATRTGIAAAASTLPIMLSGAFSGTFADRIGHRRASIVSDVVSSAIVLLVPVLHATVGIEFWQLLTLVFLRSLFATPGETARGALLPDLAERSGVQLERATAGYDAIARGARMVGAPVAGVMIALIGAPNLLVLDAATYLVSALLVWRYVPRPRAKAARERSPYLVDLRVGLGYVRRMPLVRNVVVLCMLTNMLDAGMGAVLMPLYAREVLGTPVALGAVMGVSGGAAVAGALAFGAWGSRRERRRLFVVSYLLCGVPRFAVLALQAPLWVIVATFALSGFASGPLNPIMDTSMLERLPEELRARVFGVVYAGCTAAMPVGGVLAGAAAGTIGLTGALWAFGAVYLVTTLWPALTGSWAGLDRQVLPPLPSPVTATGAANQVG